MKECLDERHEIDKRKFNVIIKGVEEKNDLQCHPKFVHITICTALVL